MGFSETKIRELLKLYKNPKLTEVEKEKLEKYIFCDRVGFSASFATRIAEFLEDGNVFSKDLIDRILKSLEEEDKSLGRPKWFLRSIMIRRNIGTGDLSSELNSHCFQKLLEYEDYTDFFPNMKYFGLSPRQLTSFGERFLLNTNDDKNIFHAVEKGILGGEWVEQAVSRLWELNRDKGMSRENFADYVLDNTQLIKTEIEPCDYYVFSGLAKLFPEFPDIKGADKYGSRLSIDKCIILCTLRGEEWRKQNAPAIKDIINSSKRHPPERSLSSLLDNYSVPPGEFFKTLLEFSAPEEFGSGFMSSPENTIRVASLLDKYITRGIEDNSTEEVLADAREFVSIYRVSKEDAAETLNWPDEFIEKIEAVWRKADEKMGVITAGEQEINTGEGMVM